MAFIGAEITVIEPGHCEIQLPYRRELSQQHGFFHAGIIGTIADNVGGYAAYTLMEKGASILTVEYKINFISPAKGDRLIGRGHVIRPGRKLTLCRCDVLVVDRGKEKPCAASQMTLISLPDFSGRPVKETP